MSEKDNEGRKKHIIPGMKDKYWMGPIKSENERKENEKSIIVEVWWDKEKDASC